MARIVAPKAATGRRLPREPSPSPSIESPAIRIGRRSWPRGLIGRGRSGSLWSRSRSRSIRRRKSGATVAFNQIHEPTGKRIKYEKVVPGVGPVDADEIVKGYQV